MDESLANMKMMEFKLWRRWKGKEEKYPKRKNGDKDKDGLK